MALGDVRRRCRRSSSSACCRWSICRASFYNVTWTGGLPTWTLVGVDNYNELVHDELLRAGLFNTLVFAVFAVGGQMLLGFVLALLCSSRHPRPHPLPHHLHPADPRARHRGRRDLEADAQFRLWPCQSAGRPDRIRADELARRQGNRAGVGDLVDIWHWTPFCFLLFLAGLESLPQDVYEAAKIDGATIWQNSPTSRCR